MRDASVDITKLCESWWGRLADSSKLEQHRYAEELLHLLGWDQPIPFSPKGGAAAVSAAPYLLRAGGQTAVAAFFVMPGTLEPPAAVVERGLDFCAATRALVNEARSVNMNYVLISDLYRSYLYDARTDELLLHADDPKGFNRELAPVLKRAHIERGSLEEVRRQPRSAVARRLREWSERWIAHIASRGRIPEETASLVVDRFLVIRFLFEHDVLRRTKWRLQQRFMELVGKATGSSPEGCGEALTHLFHDMWFDWKIDLFEGKPELDRALWDDAITMPLLREFALLSNSKFTIATILESFNCGEPSEKLRVRMVPDENEERDAYLHKQSLDTIDQARIEIDLQEEGYRAIFYWFDKVAALYERLDVDFDSRNYPDTPEEIDLFAWSELNSGRPSACADKIAHACESGFGIYYNSFRQFRIARLMLTLHLISKYAQTRQAINALPSLGKVMMKRPLVLPSERVMMPQRPIETLDDVEYYR
jgi:hypothetical protein